MRRQNQGFIYLTVLFAIALVGLSVATYSIDWTREAQREQETELLFIGRQFRNAIASYYQQTPGTVKSYPQKLDDLIFDSRYLTIKRHLRKIYTDPMSGTTNWGIVQAPDGGIMGVYSLSNKPPIKVAGFGPLESDFSNAESYASWHFTYVPPMSKSSSAPLGKK